ncbi:cytochrome b5-like heme/steroid binding domain-containing protein [Cynara cardunculus var. scolymus]|uniref:Cytochrome b5-like heme/steroid binding domain-containing protein n=1 Tax=Cynara cardunculus var. scolymus TaxID=59895 RepID=A0A103YNF2_CYNCS|nr:cytochrome b5-like heme/steroid binding domain-containing protein [Cynara cardunculus var. scolymus]
MVGGGIAARSPLQIYSISVFFVRSPMGKAFTLKEVAEHNDPKDCWLIIHGKVNSVGKDATDDFEDVGHSTTAKSMMDEFYVGDIDTATIPSKVEYTAPKQAHYNQDKTTEFIIKILQFLVPLLILGVAVGIRFYTRSAA